MRSILKALGLTIWGAIATLLSVIFIIVVYHVATKYRASTAFDLEKELNGATGQARPGLAAGSVALPNRASVPTVAPVAMRPPAETRQLLVSAFIGRQYRSATVYGKELVDRQAAEPGDLSIVAQAFYELSDCTNALVWRREAKESFQKAGLEPDYSLQVILACCDSDGKATLQADVAHKARIDRLLNSTEAAKSESGGPLVRLGELYYGFREYELAIAAIQRGLDKGNVPRLDEAYVYLGRSEVAMHHMDAAREAFAKLKEVPNISPRVVRLWMLYAEALSPKPGLPTLSTECDRSGP